jgi:sulfur-oxidizing protein SoxY
MMQSKVLKRSLLKGIAVLLATPYFKGSWASSSDTDYTQKNLQSLSIKKEGVNIDLPPLADTGNSIPMSIQIQAPAQSLIQSFEIIAPENPNPMVMQITLPKPQSNYRLSTRIRLALSQDVWVIVQLDNGSKIGQSLHCVVTLNACFDAT